jgi:hypothetical protein
MTLAWIALASAAGCVIFAVVASRGRETKCAACGLATDPGRAVDAPLCKVCGAYSVKERGKMVRVPDDYVHSRPVFATALPAMDRQWPEGCCVCSRPVTRLVPIQLTENVDPGLMERMATRAASLGFVKLTATQTYTIEVPHCALHDDGACLDIVDAAVRPTTQAPRIGERMLADRDEQGDIGIVFRSYPYFRKFLRANGMQPRPLA